MLPPANKVWGKVMFTPVFHSVHRGSLCPSPRHRSHDKGCLCPGGLCLGEVSVQEISVQGVSVQGDPPYDNELAVRFLLECILVIECTLNCTVGRIEFGKAMFDLQNHIDLTDSNLSIALSSVASGSLDSPDYVMRSEDFPTHRRRSKKVEVCTIGSCTVRTSPPTGGGPRRLRYVPLYPVQ